MRSRSSRELGLGFEQLLDKLAEEGANEAAKWHLDPSQVVAKGVRLLRPHNLQQSVERRARASRTSKMSLRQEGQPGLNGTSGLQAGPRGRPRAGKQWIGRPHHQQSGR